MTTCGMFQYGMTATGKAWSPTVVFVKSVTTIIMMNEVVGDCSAGDTFEMTREIARSETVQASISAGISVKRQKVGHRHTFI